jgi:putative FmdB family regulatory protein
MPLFEYACKACDKQFEVLIRAQETPECPACHGTDLQRRLSTFAARTAAGASASPMPAMGACGACGDPRGPGACSIN